MKEYIKKYRFLYRALIIAFCISALSLNVIPYIDDLPEDVQDPISYLVAGVFWGGALIGVILIIVEHFASKKMRMKAVDHKKYEIPRFPGVMVITNRTPNLIIIGLFAVGFGVLISDLIIGWIPGKVFFPILCITYILFCVHSIIDGKNYKAYRVVEEIKEEKKKEGRDYDGNQK